MRSTSDGFLNSIMFISIGSFTDIIQRVADARAENGAEQSRLGMANELLIQTRQTWRLPMEGSWTQMLLGVIQICPAKCAGSILLPWSHKLTN